MADPFQPKFADLVRNYSDTSGTGDLILGDPVAGFTSFAAALEPGDRFYYSVTGIQNASDSEVGRGTLQANGSIAREPLNGVLANLSSGKKSVALVAASEWFNSVGSDRAAVIRPADFGAVGDGVTDDLAALQAFNDYVFAAERSQFADWTGNFAISGQLFIGSAQPTGGDARHKLGGNLNLTQLSPTFETLRLRNLTQEHWFGSIAVQGLGLIDFASRSCGIGIALENCGNMKISGGLIADKFWYAGVMTPVVNNDGAMLGQVVATNCGSGAVAANSDCSLHADYSGAVNSGVGGGPSQRTTLTVDAFPDPLVESYAALGSQQVCARIGDTLYYVYSWDRAAGTVDIFPWLDPEEAGVGTLDWVFGGGLVTMTSDGNCIYVDKLKAQRCGIGLGVDSLYGPRVNAANISGCGAGVLIGNNPGSACVGTSIDALYTESNVLDIGFLSRFVGNNYHSINSSFELDLAKVRVLGGARRDDGTLQTQGLGTAAFGPTVSLFAQGRLHQYAGPDLDNLLGGTATFSDQRTEPRTFTQFLDSQTVTLAVEGSGEFDRLFGFRGATWRYVGSGTGGSPRGSFTFVPPPGGTINGAGVDLPMSFSGFCGPAEFAIFHTDKAQLNWSVTVTAGQTKECFGIACSDETTPVTATAAAVTMRMPYGFLVTEVRASLSTPQLSGSELMVDISSEDGSILTTPITIGNDAKTAVVSAQSIANAALADNSEISVDIDQVGDGSAKGLKVYLIGRRTS